MAGNVYGKIDCSSFLNSNTAVDRESYGSEMYTNLFNFLTYLSGNNIVDLVTYFTGSFASGTGIDYWDTANKGGLGQFSVWKWKANANRNWDWYLFVQGTSGSTNVNVNANCTPTYLDNNSVNLPTDNKGILVQMALSISGSSSYNPWNGTISMGGAFKGNPVWVTGSNPSASLHVFPRTNNISGSVIPVVTKSLCAYIMGDSSGFNSYYRTHYFADNDSLVIFDDHNHNNTLLTNAYFANYFGTFKLNPGISQSNLQYTIGQSGSLGLVMLCGATFNSSTTRQNHTIPEYTNIGPVTIDGTVIPGGVLATTNIGVRRFYLSNDNYIFNQNLYPNGFTNYKYEERPIMVVANESPFVGMIGWIDTPLFRNICSGLQSHSVKGDGTRVVFGGNTNVINRKISTVWSGSNPPGTTYFNRGGTNIFVPSSSIY